jgi:hypothetical protein
MPELSARVLLTGVSLSPDDSANQEGVGTMTAVMARWLWGTAFFEMALAALFLVLGIIISETRFGFLITAAILFATAIGLSIWAKNVSRQAAEAARIKRDGFGGRASVLTARQTGMYVNRQPQVEMELQIESDRHGSYRATKKEIVPLIMLGKLSGGALPVKIDRADRTKFVIEWDGAVSPDDVAPDVEFTSLDAIRSPTPGNRSAPVGWDAIRAEEQRTAESPAPTAADKARILATGTMATGTVLESDFAGESDAQEQPIYTLTFQIKLPGRPVMHARTRVGVPLDKIARLQPGDTVVLKVDPRDASTMAIDWDATEAKDPS